MNWRPGDQKQDTTAGPAVMHGPHPSKPLVRLSRLDVLLLALALENFIETHWCRHMPLAYRRATEIRDELARYLTTK